jgi:cobalt-precorrin 5A hydrolase
MNTAVLAITPRGAELARKLAAALPVAACFLPERFRQSDHSVYFNQPLKQFLPDIFQNHDGLICIMATGIVVRLLAPVLQGKAVDPAVVVVDEAGRFAISLLSGHLGGANRLAEQVANALGGQAVITTATDVNNLPAWDAVAGEAGLTIEPLAQIKLFNRLLLEGQAIALVDPRQRIAGTYADVPGVACCSTFMEAEASGVAERVYVTHRLVPTDDESVELLLLRPRDLVLGIGCNRGTPANEIDDAVMGVLTNAALSSSSVHSIATIVDKQDEVGLNQYAQDKGLPVVYFSAAELNAMTVPSPPSPHALRAVGASGVCEPAALRAARSGHLLVRKQKCGNVTVAVAEISAK